MSKSEYDVWHDVHAHMRPCFWRRIENDAGVGDPDVHFGINGIFGWMEGKYARSLPATPLTGVFTSLNRGLTTEQENWLYDYARQGGLCWVFARVVKDYILVPGIRALEFNAMTWSQFNPYRIELDMIRMYLVTPKMLGWDLTPRPLTCGPEG